MFLHKSVVLAGPAKQKSYRPHRPFSVTLRA
jgi:hypothetical protein